MSNKVLAPVSFTEWLLFTTTRIEAVAGDGSVAAATGFFYAVTLAPDKRVTLMITNRHALEGYDSVRFSMHIARPDANAPSGTWRHVKFENVARSYDDGVYYHPDPTIDLAAMNVSGAANMLSLVGQRPFYGIIEGAPSAADFGELTAVEEVIMIGYPNGLWDTKHNLPIVRRGITATHPAVDHCGNPDGLIDMACFGGSSGSPVFIASNGSYMTKDGNIAVGHRRLFLGVLYAAAQMTSKGVVELQRELPEKGIVTTSSLIHLGYYVKAREVQVLADYVLSKQGLR